MPRHLERKIYIWLTGVITVSSKDTSVDFGNIHRLKRYLNLQSRPIHVTLVCEGSENESVCASVSSLLGHPVGKIVPLNSTNVEGPSWLKFVAWGEKNLEGQQAICLVPGGANDIVSLHSHRVHMRFLGVKTLSAA